MSDLISRSALIDDLSNIDLEMDLSQLEQMASIQQIIKTVVFNISTIVLAHIEEQPIAYDKETVIEQLEEYLDEANQFKVGGMVADMIEVVKAGGIDG